jgi:8-oxo-dGTP diphosphatase
VSPRQVRVVAALLADPARPGQFLIQQRLPGGSRALLWEFPGGKVEAGETDQAALRRECREELAVDVEVGPLALQTRHDYEDLSVDLVLYRARIVAGEPVPHGAHALRWATPVQMRALPFCEADIPLLHRLPDL